MNKISFIGKYLWILAFLIVGFFICQCTYNRCSGGGNADTLSVDSIVKHDTIVITKIDTLPTEKEKVVVKYVKIPNNTYHSDTVTVTDSIQMQLVQKTYSDDSTYTAYVSGLDYENMPKLDSISIRQREIVNTVVKTITIQKRRSRWSVGLQGGYGFGLQSHNFEPYVGLGINYALFPP